MYTLSFSLWLFTWIYNNAKPNYVDYNNPNQMKHVKYKPLQTCALVHALITTGCGFMYIAGFLDVSTVFAARWFSTAYLLFDIWEHTRIYVEVQQFQSYVELNKLESLMSAEANTFFSHHPLSVLFHHVCTLLIMFGFFVHSDISGCILYFQSELPVVFIHVARMFAYHGLQSHPMFQVANFISVISFFVTRLVLFPLVFSVTMLPMFPIFNPFAWTMLACLFMVYVMNVLNFNQLLKTTGIQFPWNGSQFLALVSMLILPQRIWQRQNRRKQYQERRKPSDNTSSVTYTGKTSAASTSSSSSALSDSSFYDHYEDAEPKDSKSHSDNTSSNYQSNHSNSSSRVVHV